MSMQEKLNDLLDFTFARRHIMRGSVAGGTLALATASGLGRAFAQGLNDVDILQFALTLEHLEARMYLDMNATGILTGKEKTYLEIFGSHEAAHVAAITSALTSLGATPVTAQSSYNFPAFNTREAILNFAKTVEDTGVGAYQGAAAAITNKDILAAAGSIVQIEARHAALINLLLGLDPVPQAATSGLTIDQVNAAVGPILGA